MKVDRRKREVVEVRVGEKTVVDVDVDGVKIKEIGTEINKKKSKGTGRGEGHIYQAMSECGCWMCCGI